MKPAIKALVAAACVATGIGMLAAANYAAGAFLFLSYKQHPRNVTFSTIWDAWATEPDKPTKRKIVLSMLVGGLVCIAAPVGLILSATARRRQLHGSARLAHPGDVKEAGLRAERGILLGRYAGQYLRLPGFEFVLLAAPTRSGKGTAFVIPNLLTFTHSAVVQDIKGENHVLTAAYRRQHLGQKVFYFNPFSENSHRSNPLSYVSTDPNQRIGDLQVMAANIYIEQPNEPPIWVNSARDVFLGLTLLVLETPQLPHTLGEVLRQASGKGMPLQDYLASVIRKREEAGDPLSRICTDSLRRFLGASENTLKGILSTFLAPLAIWANPLVDKATSGDDFDVRDLRKKPMTVYVCAPVKQILGANLLMNLFFAQVIGENLREQPQDNPELKYQALFMMDEFTAMGRVSIIAKGVAYMASYNLRLAIVIQDYEQLVDVYGKEAAHNIASNMGAKIYFAPNELEDARRLSETVGYITETARSKQYSNNASASGGSTGRSVTVSEQRRALMLPQELRELDPAKELVVRSGIPVILADKAVYYRDPALKKAFASVPTCVKEIDGQARVMPVAPELPQAFWYDYEEDVARSDFYLHAPDVAATDSGNGEARLLAMINRIRDDEPPEPEASEALSQLAATKVGEYLASLQQQTHSEEHQSP
jgi:type IV secretion system protein VirD4